MPNPAPRNTQNAASGICTVCKTAASEGVVLCCAQLLCAKCLLKLRKFVNESLLDKFDCPYCEKVTPFEVLLNKLVASPRSDSVRQSNGDINKSNNNNGKLSTEQGLPRAISLSSIGMNSVSTTLTRNEALTTFCSICLQATQFRVTTCCQQVFCVSCGTAAKDSAATSDCTVCCSIVAEPVASGPHQAVPMHHQSLQSFNATPIVETIAPTQQADLNNALLPGILKHEGSRTLAAKLSGNGYVHRKPEMVTMTWTKLMPTAASISESPQNFTNSAFIPDNLEQVLEPAQYEPVTASMNAHDNYAAAPRPVMKNEKTPKEKWTKWMGDTTSRRMIIGIFLSLIVLFFLVVLFINLLLSNGI